jgi:hypothetical protein
MEPRLYKLVGKSRDGADTSERTASSLIEANAAYNYLMRDGYFTVTIIDPHGRELSDREFNEAEIEENRQARRQKET